MFEGLERPPMRTSIGKSTESTIEVHGFDLASELMGTIGFGDMVYLMVAGRLPAASESRVFNAVLVALTDHGLTPTALAARLTYLGAPDSIQGAIAAGILGAGSVFLGVFEDVGRMLETVEVDGDNPAQIAAVAQDVARRYAAAGLRVPGLGHPEHKNGDPRTARLRAIAEEEGCAGRNLRLMEAICVGVSQELGRKVVLNAAGASGAILADLGFEGPIMRGFAVVARAAGVLGHLQEERHSPIAKTVWVIAEQEVEHVARTDDPHGPRR